MLRFCLFPPGDLSFTVSVAMEMDEKLRWLEVRITSSLRPRNEDSKNMLLNEDNR